MKEKVQTQINNHAQTCKSCAGTAEWVRQIISAMASRDLVDAPEYLLHRAISIFPRKRRILPRLVRAVLRFDSWAEPMAAGMRSKDGAPRQMMYQTSAYNVFLMLLPSPEQGSVVIGQLVPNRTDVDTGGYVVQLKQKNRILSRDITNPSGEFYLKTRSRRGLTAILGAPKKNIDLLIYKQDDKILLPDITGIHA